jgi:hypothetical protein
MAEWLSLVLGAGMLLGIAGWRSGQCAWRARRRQRLAEICQVLLGLMQELQLHRGLSGAVLDRRSGFRAELDANEYKLQRSLHALAEHYGKRHAVFRERRWRILLGHWEALRNNWQGLGFETNIYAHGEVIRGLIGILKSLARDNARLLGEADARAVADWPALMEDLGLLRALGLHLLGPGAGDTGAALSETITARLQTADARLRQVAGSDAVGDTVDPALVARTGRGLGRVSWLLDGNAARYHPHTFYEEMSAIIDDWYRALCNRLQAAAPAPSVARRLVSGLRPQAKTG